MHALDLTKPLADARDGGTLKSTTTQPRTREIRLQGPRLSRPSGEIWVAVREKVLPFNRHLVKGHGTFQWS